MWACPRPQLLGRKGLPDSLAHVDVSWGPEGRVGRGWGLGLVAVGRRDTVSCAGARPPGAAGTRPASACPCAGWTSRPQPPMRLHAGAAAGPAHPCRPLQVEGYSVGCECSPDGDLLVTGSADGRVLLYCFRTASRARTLHGHTQACVGATFHPVLPSVLATCSWEGDIKIWH